MRFRVIVRDTSTSPFTVESSKRVGFFFWSSWERHPGSSWYQSIEIAALEMRKFAAAQLQLSRKPQVGTVIVLLKNYTEADEIVDKLSGKI